MVVLVVGVALGACFPYKAHLRGRILGVVMDSDGLPVPGAQVEACTLPEGTPIEACPHRAVVTADADGGFAIAAVTRWALWTLAGTATQLTVLVACAPGGQLGGRLAGGASQAVRVGPADHVEEFWPVAKAIPGSEDFALEECGRLVRPAADSQPAIEIEP